MAPRTSILVVDDDPSLCTLIAAIFSRQGIHVDHVRDGEEALPHILDGPYETVLLDVMVPRFSGIDVVRCLRKSAPEALRRIVVMTAFSSRTFDEATEMEGVFAVVRKPFDITDLSTLVGRCIRQKRIEHLVSWRDASATVQSQLQAASSAAGASAGVVASVSRRADVELLWSYGYDEGEVESFQRLPLDAPLPLCEAIRSRSAVFVPTRDEAARLYPGLEALMLRSGNHALAVAPALRHGDVVGAIGWSFRRAQEFPPGQREHLCALAASRGAWLPLFGGHG